MWHKKFLLLALISGLLAGCSHHRHDSAKISSPVSTNLPDPQPYSRVAHPDSNTVQLQIAVRRFVPVDHRGPTIWLTATAHVGEPQYYHALQQHLDSRTVVLYEGVNAESHVRHVPRPGDPPAPAQPAPKPAQDRPPSSSKEGFSMQSELAKSLGLVFQLEAIDYDRTNFLNSDLSVFQLQKLMLGDPDARPAGPGEKGRTDPTLQSLMQIMNGTSLLGSLMKAGVHLISSSPQLQSATKLILIETLGSLKGDMAEMRGLPAELRNLMKVLIVARNQAVIDDLKTELKLVPRSGSISIFYGSGHMENMEQHLTRELNYRPAGDVWLPVFSVDLKEAGMSESDLQMIRNLIKWQLEKMQK
jgi:hypothetical protein